MNSAAPEGYIRTFNRFELKYLVHYSQASELMRSMAPYVHTDANAGPGGYYKIASRYYDSADLRCYWEKVNGERFRRKVRLRTYGDAPKKAFLEIKQRTNLSVQKRRSLHDLNTLEQQMKLMQRGEYTVENESVMDEVCNLVNRYRLEPKVVISYNRAAFFDLYRRDLRITFDRNIKCRTLGLELGQAGFGGKFIVPPTIYILEVKFNEVVPRWLCTCLNHHDLKVERVSKYCLGVETMGLEQY